MKQEIKSGIKYAIVNDIYPPYYSVIELHGIHGGYTHVKKSKNKIKLMGELIKAGAIICDYPPQPPQEEMMKGEGQTLLSQYELYIQYCDEEMLQNVIPLHFVTWREAHQYPHI